MTTQESAGSSNFTGAATAVPLELEELSERKTLPFRDVDAHSGCFFFSNHAMRNAFAAVRKTGALKGLKRADRERLRRRVLEYPGDVGSEIKRWNRCRAKARKAVPKENVQHDMFEELVQLVLQQALVDSLPLRIESSPETVLRAALEFVSDGRRRVVSFEPSSELSVQEESRVVQMIGDEYGSQVASVVHSYIRAGFYSPDDGRFESMNPITRFLVAYAMQGVADELELRGHRCVFDGAKLHVFCGSQMAAERISASMSRLATSGNLAIRVGSVLDYRDVVLFGYEIFAKDGGLSLRISDDAKRRAKETLRQLTLPDNGMSNAARVRAVSTFVRSFVYRFRFAEAKRFYADIDEWLRHRIRRVIWHQWKLVRSRRRELEKRGVDSGLATAWSNTRKGDWAASNCRAVNQALSNSVLAQMGYVFFGNSYRNVCASL